MTRAEQQDILAKLNAGRDALAAALHGVDEATAARQPSAGGWSIRDCVEHMVVSESYLLTRLACAQFVANPPDKRARETLIAERAANRARPIPAPVQAQPTGQFATLHQAVAAFDAARAGVLRWVESCAHDPRCLLTDHPLFYGPVNCWETLIMIAAHPGRHAQQIVAIRSALQAEPPGNS